MKFRVAVSVLVLLALFATVGCQRPEREAKVAGAPGGPVVFRIGYGKGGNMNIVRLRGTLEKRLAPQGVRVEWINFPMGPQMMEAIGTGSLELGSCAATPPLFAQAAGYDFVYVANTPPGKSGNGGAILVPTDSPLHTVADLKGKRIAFQPGSVWQYLLIKVLERDRLRYEAIHPVKMPPADATAAFHSGSIDAWVQGEPYRTLVQQKKEGRILADTSDIPTSGGFLIGSRTFATAHPELIRVALEEAQAAGLWARANPAEAARLTASTVGLDAATLEKMIRDQENTELRVVDEPVIRQQQEQADLLTRLHVLPRSIDVRQAVLDPERNARLLPEARRQANRGTPARSL